MTEPDFWKKNFLGLKMPKNRVFWTLWKICSSIFPDFLYKDVELKRTYLLWKNLGPKIDFLDFCTHLYAIFFPNLLFFPVFGQMSWFFSVFDILSCWFSTPVEEESENVCQYVSLSVRSKLWGRLETSKIVEFGWNFAHLIPGWIPGGDFFHFSKFSFLRAWSQGLA